MKHTSTAKKIGTITALVLMSSLAACAAKKPDFDPKNPPVGGTPAEYGFQYAQAIAKRGNCDQALPILICLGEQGPGWELAMHSSGVCALEAAKLWTGPLQVRPGFYNKESTVSFDKPYYQTQDALYAKGLTQLHRSAAAGWPDSQAVLVKEYGTADKTAEQRQEAKLWLTRYDDNTRRKIYGGNSVDTDLRARLTSVDAPDAADPRWQKIALPRTPAKDPFCRHVIRARPVHSAPEPPQSDDDPLLEKLPMPGDNRRTPRH